MHAARDSERPLTTAGGAGASSIKMTAKVAVRIRFVALLLVTAGCTGSPTAPGGSASGIVVTGPQILRIVYQSPCATTGGASLFPFIYTRVSVTASANEWVAIAGGADAGDVQVRFRQSGQGVISGSMPVVGTIAGTAIHMPDGAGKPSFSSVGAIIRLLTPENRQLLVVIRDRKPASVAELVTLTGRAQPNLTRTLANLEAAGFVAMKAVGRRRVPRVLVKKIVVEINPYAETDRLQVA